MQNIKFSTFDKFIYFTRCRIDIFIFAFHNTYQCRQLSLAIVAFAFPHNALSCTIVGYQLFTAGILCGKRSFCFKTHCTHTGTSNGMAVVITKDIFYGAYRWLKRTCLGTETAGTHVHCFFLSYTSPFAFWANLRCEYRTKKSWRWK